MHRLGLCVCGEPVDGRERSFSDNLWINWRRNSMNSAAESRFREVMNCSSPLAEIADSILR